MTMMDAPALGFAFCGRPGRIRLLLVSVLALAVVCLTASACRAEDEDLCPPEQPVSAKTPLAAPSASLSQESAPVNQGFTPLLLPSEAAQRGISLGGEARLCRTETNHYRLLSGCIFMQTLEPMRIDTCRTSVYAAAGSAIVVHNDHDVTTVLNLHDRSRDSVRAVVAEKYISLNPGEEAGFVSSRAQDPERAAAGTKIAYRRARTVLATPDLKVVVFEFSLGDALKHCRIFKQLKESPYDVDHKLLAQIVKTAAAINTMYAKTREPYSRGQQAPAAADLGSKPKTKLSAGRAKTES